MAKNITPPSPAAAPLRLAASSFIGRDPQAQNPSTPVKSATFEQAKVQAADIDRAKLMDDLKAAYPPLDVALGGRDFNGLHKLVCDRLGKYDENVLVVQLSSLLLSSFDPEKGTRRPVGKTLALVTNYPGGVDALLPEEAPKQPEEVRVVVPRERRPLSDYPLIISNLGLDKKFVAADLGDRPKIEQFFVDKGLSPNSTTTATSDFLNGNVIGVMMKFTPEALWVAEKCQDKPEILFARQFENAQRADQLREAQRRQAEADALAVRGARFAAIAKARDDRHKAREAEREGARQKREADQKAAKDAKTILRQQKEAARMAERAARSEIKRIEKERADAERQALRDAQRQGGLTLVRRTKQNTKRPRLVHQDDVQRFVYSERAAQRIVDPFDRELTKVLPKLQRYARSLAGEAEAADLVLVTAEKALEHRDGYKLGSNMLAWTTTIMRNHFYSERRKDGREVLFDPQGFVPNAAVFPAQQSSLELKEVEERILSRMPREQRDAILLAATGMSYEDIAEREKSEVGTVKSRVSRGRAFMRYISDPEGATEEVMRRGLLKKGDDANEVMRLLAKIKASERGSKWDNYGDADVADVGEDDEKPNNKGLETIIEAAEIADQADNYLFDATTPYSKIDTGAFVLQVNNNSQTSFIKDGMISLTREETIAFLKQWQNKDGAPNPGSNAPNPASVTAVANKLSARDPSWVGVLGAMPPIAQAGGYNPASVSRLGF